MTVMKVGMSAGTLFVAGICLTTVCVADDVQDIKTALKQHYTAFNAGMRTATFDMRPKDTPPTARKADCWGATLLLKYKRRTSKPSLIGA